MEYIIIAIVCLVVGFVAGALVMRNNYKKFREVEAELKKTVDNKVFKPEDIINYIKVKLNI
jgi:uncharacterized membrane-anchored protein YhcB (DUF1043 family)